MALSFLLISLLLFTFSSSAPIQDLVNYPFAGYVQHNWYSGYLNFSTGAYHYVFFQSQRDPDNDPLVLWLNGGACSSLIGMLNEHGPFLTQTNETSLKINDFSWNEKANIIYLQSPGGVGFSISYTNNTYDDGTVAQDNYKALTAFFRKFPNLKKNDFYISGQSYAGIYIPYLATKIQQMNKLPNTETIMNLKGILIGNACTDPRECYQPDSQNSMSIWQYQFLYNHNYLTDNEYNTITGACILNYKSAACRQIRTRVDKKFYSTSTVLNNIYQPCYHQKIPKPTSQFRYGRLSRRTSNDIEDECEDLKGIYSFFNQALIPQQLNVEPVFYDICSDDVGKKYKSFSNASIWLYPSLIKSGIRIWIFSGDVDANVPITGTLRWIQLMKDVEGIPVVQPWREWWVPGLHKHQDQMGGMVWKLRGLTFISVKGAGHLVPTDKPRQAQIMFQAFISGNDLPYKTP